MTVWIVMLADYPIIAFRTEAEANTYLTYAPQGIVVPVILRD